MVIPPPPPPPPLQPPSAVLPSGERKTAVPPRRLNNPTPQTTIPTRPAVDPKALQHAAARLRKTGYNEQIRSDFKDLPDGRVDRQDQQLPRRDWKDRTQFNGLGGYEAGAQVPAETAGAVYTGSFGHLHRHPDSLNDFSKTPAKASTYPEQHPNSILAPQHITKPNATANYSTYDVITTTTTNYSNPSDSYSTISTVPPARNFRSYHKDDHVIDGILSGGKNNNVYEDLRSQPTSNEAVFEWTEKYTPGKSSPSTYNPREKIHHYATTNYVSSRTESLKRTVTPSREQARDHIQNTLARQLRDDGLTTSQKYANQFQKPASPENARVPFDTGRIFANSYNGDEVDSLVSQMRNNFNPHDTVQFPRTDGRLTDTVTSSAQSTTKRVVESIQQYVCVACNKEITGDQPGCNAMGKIFHVDCFKCQKCERTLAGSSFYNIDDKPVCEGCYQDTLEKCSGCHRTIQDKLLRACGGTYHINCFVCYSCKRTLDGIPFTLDKENNVHCVPCFHDKFAPRCAHCSKPIIPQEGEKDSVRVVAMDKSFHVECYKCEDCGLQLSSKKEGHGCYPLDSHLLCKTCNGNRLRVAGSA